MVPLNPPLWWCSIAPASARDLERVASGTTVASATHILEGEYHPGITTKTELIHEDGSVYYVAGVVNPEKRNIVTIALCNEVVA
jgi:hypothetical protein